jgi:hypothetical protein
LLAKTVPHQSYWNEFRQNNKISSSTNCGTDVVFSIAPKVRAKFILEVYENLIKFVNPELPTPDTTPPIREVNDIKTFSQKSRKHLFDIFNKLNYSQYGIPIFLSLTYHYDCPPSRENLKQVLENFAMRLKRMLPPYHYIWKLEYQQRGTPHFHMIIFPLNKNDNFYTDEIEEKIKAHWLDLKTCKCKHCKKYAAHVVKVYTYEHCLSYIAKEIAKVQDRYEDHNLGRIWSSSQNLRCQPINQLKISKEQFNSLLDVAIEDINKKILNPKLKPETKLKMKNVSQNYLIGLKELENNCTVYISNQKIFQKLISIQSENKNKVPNKKLILKKYNWR